MAEKQIMIMLFHMLESSFVTVDNTDSKNRPKDDKCINITDVPDRLAPEIGIASNH